MTIYTAAMRSLCLTIALRSVITIGWRPVWKKFLKSEIMRGYLLLGLNRSLSYMLIKLVYSISVVPGNVSMLSNGFFTESFTNSSTILYSISVTLCRIEATT